MSSTVRLKQGHKELIEKGPVTALHTIFIFNVAFQLKHKKWVVVGHKQLGVDFGCWRVLGPQMKL